MLAQHKNKAFEEMRFQRDFHISICSMVLVYLATTLGEFVWVNVGILIPDMEHMSMGTVIRNSPYIEYTYTIGRLKD